MNDLKTMMKIDALRSDRAWKQWWDELGHVARCNRDMARTREAFEAGYMAALAQDAVGASSPSGPASAIDKSPSKRQE